jgi:hypothetical protein
MMDLFLAQTSSPNAEIGSIIGVIVALVLTALFFGLFVWSLAWVYGDAERRGKSGCLVVLVILFFGWPLSLLLWLAFRPG